MDGWRDRRRSGIQILVAGVVLVCLPVLALLIWGDFRKDKLPNFLLRYVDGYFESNGLSFAIFPMKFGDQCTWIILFQNRYEKLCQSVVTFRPGIRNFGIARANMEEVRVQFDCDGGAFGVARVPVGIPAKYQGKKLPFDVAAATHYPTGAGKLVRYREGTNAGTRFKNAGDLAILTLSGLTGHLHYRRQSHFACELPAQVSETARDEPSTRILWKPGDPADAQIAL